MRELLAPAADSRVRKIHDGFTNKFPELGRKLKTEFGKLPQELEILSDVIRAGDMSQSRGLTFELNFDELRKKTFTSCHHGSAESKQSRQVVSEFIRECVNSILAKFRAGQQRLRSQLKHVDQMSGVLLVDFWSIARFRTLTSTPEVVHPYALGKSRNLVYQQSSDDTRVCLARLHGFVVLLLSNQSGSLCDLRCALGGSMRQHGNPQGCACRTNTNCGGSHNSPGANGHGCPVREISPICFKRTKSNAHEFSLLACILTRPEYVWCSAVAQSHEHRNRVAARCPSNELKQDTQP